MHAIGNRAFFHVADAAGHGAEGEAVWQRHAAAFQAAWGALIASPGDLGDLRAFGRALNSMFHPSDAVCLAVGALTEHGGLRVANFGFGVHVLASGASGPTWADDPASLFGLKLGWLDAERWEATPRAFVATEATGIRRVMLITDGFLGEDHRDPTATLDEVRRLGEACAALPLEDAASRVTELPHDGDDATVLVVERR